MGGADIPPRRCCRERRRSGRRWTVDVSHESVSLTSVLVTRGRVAWSATVACVVLAVRVQLMNNNDACVRVCVRACVRVCVRAIVLTCVRVCVHHACGRVSFLCSCWPASRTRLQVRRHVVTFGAACGYGWCCWYHVIALCCCCSWLLQRALSTVSAQAACKPS